MKKKILIIILIVLAVVILVGVIVTLVIFRPMTLSQGEVGFSELSLSTQDSKAVLKGHITSSSTAFCGYDYYIEDGTVFVTIKGCLSNPLYKSGSVEIEIEDEAISSCERIVVEYADKTETVYLVE
ncbi:MAG: hypothetical protein LBL82_05855 [Oscillospiraceae bacterium]|jgi:hypothetical protein|nr:hypothetical protein [Oscillospiraceae bacterium]